MTVVAWLALIAFARAATAAKIHGVNYGSRFVPEQFFGLYGTDDILYKGIEKHWGADSISLCDVNVADASQRMSTFLDANIKKEHFTKMAELGFNTVRLPLGYWNLIDLQAGTTPNAPGDEAARFQALQNLMPSAGSYMKWIDRVFDYAGSVGMRVMPDLHGAPGGQSGNQNTGCDHGDGNAYFDTDWNRALAVQAIDAMAKICARKGSTCWGISLLNEPHGPWTTARGGLSRDNLAQYYKTAIAAARRHLSTDVPIVIMDWPQWLTSFWKTYAPREFSKPMHGKIVFATHLYQFPNPWTTDLNAAKNSFANDMQASRDFVASTGFELLFSEYALNNHGGGDTGDAFDYAGLARWFVSEFDQIGIGSMVWNFDSFYSAWGPVDHADRVGRGPLPWKDIFNGDSPPIPTPPPTAPSPSGAGQCCYGGSACATVQSCQGGWCGQSSSNCEGNCKGKWCPKSFLNVTGPSVAVV